MMTRPNAIALGGRKIKGFSFFFIVCMITISDTTKEPDDE
jgi:hypothetical protein